MSDTLKMQSNEAFSSSQLAGNEFQYRTISKAAVASIAFAVLGLGAFVFQAFVLSLIHI